MADSSESGSQSFRKMTRAHFQTLTNVQFNSYIMDPVLNVTFHLMKEVKQLEGQIQKVEDEIERYVKFGEEMVKHQETFLHRKGLCPKGGTRDVGVYVSITPPSEETGQAAADSKHNQVNPPVVHSKSANGLPMPVQPHTQTSSTNSNLQKRNKVDFVDLTADDDGAELKMTAVNHMQDKGIGHRSPVVPQVTTNGSLPVQYPSLGTSFIGQPMTAPVTYLLPSNMLARAIRPGDTTKLPISAVPSSRTSRMPGPLTAKAVTESSKSIPSNLPPLPESKNLTKDVLLEPPPKPCLSISKSPDGIVLSWNLTLKLSQDKIKYYEIFGFEQSSKSNSSKCWKKIGEVKALPLPMACTLMQINEGGIYHFVIRAVDVHLREGPLSDVATINLMSNYDVIVKK